MDEIDFSILRILSDNCRAPYEAIARSVSLTGNAVRERIKKLVEDGVIERFWLCVNPAFFGYNVVVSLFESYPPAGKYMFVAESLNGYYATASLSRGTDGMHGSIMSFVYPKSVPSCCVSEMDKKIIRSLRKDPRKSIYSIARELSISTKSVKKSIDKLIENDVIQPTIFVQPANIEGFIPYYLVIRNDASRMVDDGFRNYWFAQSIGNITIMECYARNFREIDERLLSLSHREGVSSCIYVIPSRLFFSDAEIPEI